jgi:hypothetical protein
MYPSNQAYPRTSGFIDWFIDENLSLPQIRWLVLQTEALQQTKGTLLEAILREFFALNSVGIWAGINVGEISRCAVGEFILRHHSEFLPTPAFGQ